MKRFDERQLKFNLPDLDEIQDEVERGVSPTDARMIAEAARQELQKRFDDGERPAWQEDYVSLLQHGWPWRVAAYIAWAAAPRSGRKPETLQQLATDVLGLASPRVIYTWRKKYPTIDTGVSSLQTAVLHKHRRDVLEALASMASQPDYKSFNDRKLFLELTGDYVPKSKVELDDKRAAQGLSTLSTEELAALIDDGDDQAPEDPDIPVGVPG